MKTPSKSFSILVSLGTTIYVVVTILLATAQAVAIVVIAYGFIATAVCVLVGPVFVPFHPFYAQRAGKGYTLHAQNLADINAIPGLGTPRDLVEAIRTRAFSLVVLDVEGEGEAAERGAMARFPRAS